MADKDYNFTVFADTLDPLGPVGKENLDVIRIIYDWSCWVDTNEHLAQIDFPTIQALPYAASTIHWRQDYPPDTQAADTQPPDTYPLRVLSEAITGSPGNVAEIKLVAGTPGFSYVLSYVVTGSTTQRRKQIDTLINIEQPLNTAMVGPGDIDPNTLPPISITGSTALPMGFDGWVVFSNTGNDPAVVITLPPNPSLGQMVGFIDVLGKDGAYPVTFRADGDAVMDGDGTTNFVSTINYDVLQWTWTGSNWHLRPNRFNFLA
jgi:hypothetical protein